MRRIWTLGILLILLCLPAWAGADRPYDDDTVIITQSADRDVLALMTYIYDRVMLDMPIIELPANTLYDDVNTAMEALTRAYPELCHVSNRWSVNYYRDKPEIAVSLEPEYLDTFSMDALVPVALSVAGEAAGSQTEKAELLHDWLCERVAYDMSGGHTASAYGAIVSGWAQCEGYAKALVLLYRMAGISSGVVTGYFYDDRTGGGPHAWVVARIDGVNTLIDPTADDSIEQTVTHWYYGLTDAQMALDHTPDAGSIIPVCVSESVNWHARRGLLLRSMGDMNALLRQMTVSREPIEFRFADQKLFQAIYGQMDQLIDDYNAAAPWEEQFYGRYLMWFCPEQNGGRLAWGSHDHQE